MSWLCLSFIFSYSIACCLVEIILTPLPSQPYTDHFTHEKQLFPLSSALKPKSSFAPSKWEQRKVSKLVQAIKAGRIQPRKPPHKPKFYDLWGQGDEVRAMRTYMYIWSCCLIATWEEVPFNFGSSISIQYLLAEHYWSSPNAHSCTSSKVAGSRRVLQPASRVSSHAPGTWWVGGARPWGQREGVLTSTVWLSPTGPRIPQVYSGEVRAMFGPLPVSTATENEGDFL